MHRKHSLCLCYLAGKADPDLQDLPEACVFWTKAIEAADLEVLEVLEGSLEVVKHLMANGADPNAQKQQR